jgi:hypothetical protein
VDKRSRRTAVPYEAPLAGKADQPEDRGEEGTPEVNPSEDPEAEAEAGQGEGKDEGLAEKVKEKGKELLDKVSGPDVPPSLGGEERRD